jgi:hypothetical protein
VKRLRLEALFDKHVSTTDRRCTVPHARALGVLLRSTGCSPLTGPRC